MSVNEQATVAVGSLWTSVNLAHRSMFFGRKGQRFGKMQGDIFRHTKNFEGC